MIPFGSVLPPLDIRGVQDPIPLVVAPGVDVGMIYVFALSSIAVYGVILGGWASNNKYSFLGGAALECPVDRLRNSAGPGHSGRGAVARLAAAGHDHRRSRRKAACGTPSCSRWVSSCSDRRVCRSGPAAVRFARGEQELIGGYHTEYSGMKLLLFLIAEFLHMVTAAFLIVILFLGGWHFWGTDRLAATTVTWPIAIAADRGAVGENPAGDPVLHVVRWSWPRFRFDQLMALAWKVMLPLGLVNLVAVAVLVEYRDAIAQAHGHRQRVDADCDRLGGDDCRPGLRRGLLSPLARPTIDAARRRHCRSTRIRRN